VNGSSVFGSKVVGKCALRKGEGEREMVQELDMGESSTTRQLSLCISVSLSPVHTLCLSPFHSPSLHLSVSLPLQLYFPGCLPLSLPLLLSLPWSLSLSVSISPSLPLSPPRCLPLALVSLCLSVGVPPCLFLYPLGLSLSLGLSLCLSVGASSCPLCLSVSLSLYLSLSVSLIPI